jgi:F-type H+-transporting ATPase subunit b
MKLQRFLPVALLVVAAVAIPAFAFDDTAAHAAGEAAHAAADHAHGHEEVGAMPTKAQGIATAVTAIVVFTLTAAFLMIKVWPTIGKALDERANKITGEIEAAEAARKQAKDALDQYQQSLSQARAEAQKEIDKARAQATIIAAELKAKADVELSQLRERALKDIEGARRAAVADLYSEAATLATTMAGKILRREVNAGDRQKLVDESVAQLQNNRN